MKKTQVCRAAMGGAKDDSPGGGKPCRAGVGVFITWSPISLVGLGLPGFSSCPGSVSLSNQTLGLCSQEA